MFNLFKDFLVDLLIEESSVYELDYEEVVQGKKASYVLVSERNMISVEVLPDFTCDFMMVEIDSEKTLLNETNKYDSLEELKNGIKNLIKKVSAL